MLQVIRHESIEILLKDDYFWNLGKINVIACTSYFVMIIIKKSQVIHYEL